MCPHPEPPAHKSAGREPERMAVPSAPIEVQDLSKILNLAVPTPRTAQRAAALRLLAPAELSMPSITFQHRAPPKPPASPPPREPAPPPAPPLQAVFPGWLVPGGYALCGLCMGVCNLVAPGGFAECACILCPAWSCTLLMHAATQQGAVLWWGVLAMLLAPFIVLVGEPLFGAFYLVAFAGFSSCRFWEFTQGPAFILVCVCCFGALSGGGLSLLSDQPRAQLSAGFFFALVSAVICTQRLAKLSFRVGQY